MMRKRARFFQFSGQHVQLSIQVRGPVEFQKTDKKKACLVLEPPDMPWFGTSVNLSQVLRSDPHCCPNQLQQQQVDVVVVQRPDTSTPSGMESS